MIYSIYWTLLLLSIYLVPSLFLIFINRSWAKSDVYLKSIRENLNSSWQLGVCVLIVFILSQFNKDFSQNEINNNFILHFVGGGVVCSIILNYFIDNLKTKVPLWLQCISLYILVSSLGIANELLEFALDMYSGMAFSSDRFDTWRDLTANTSGAFVGFILISFFKYIKNPPYRNRVDIDEKKYRLFS